MPSMKQDTDSHVVITRNTNCKIVIDSRSLVGEFSVKMLPSTERDKVKKTTEAKKKSVALTKFPAERFRREMLTR